MAIALVSELCGNLGPGDVVVGATEMITPGLGRRANVVVRYLLPPVVARKTFLSS